jgi:penicillin-binding protein 2
MQLSHSLTTLVNKGKRYIPQILRGTLENNQITLTSIKERRPMDISKESNWDIVLDAMYGTVNREDGTAQKAFRDAHYLSAGKTGTAQLVSIAQDAKYDKDSLAKNLHDNAMYVGFAPYDKPQISVAVALENAGFGGAQAAPVARALMDYYFKDQVLSTVKKPERTPPLTAIESKKQGN